MKGKKMSNERVAITGASSGIGKEMAMEVANRGGIPILLARSENKLQQISQQIYEETGIKAPYYRLDITDVKAIKFFPFVFRKII